MTRKVQYKEYRWRKGWSGKLEDARIFGARVDWLEERLGHPPTSKEVLEDASDSKSPIHDLFEWNDSVAAEQYRKQQASRYLSSLTIMVEITEDGKTKDYEMPVRVVVENTAYQDHGHEHIRSVMRSPKKRQQLLENAIDELNSVEKRYRYLKELRRVFTEVEAVRKEVILT